MSNEDKLRQIAIENLHVAWDFATGFPVSDMNPGRDNADSWGCPETSVPLDMLEGFDVTQGAGCVITLNNFAELFPHLLKEFETPQQWVEHQRRQRIDQLRQDAASKVKEVNCYRFTVDKVDDDTKEVTDSVIEILKSDVADYLESVITRKCSHIVASAQRRTTAAPVTLLLGEAMGTLQRGDFKFIMVEREFSNYSEYFDSVVAENADNCRQDYSLASKVTLAAKLMARNPTLGVREIQRKLSLMDQYNADKVRVKSNTGNAQKVHRGAALHITIPEFRFAQRIVMSPKFEGEGKDRKAVYVEGGPIDFKTANKEDLQALLGKRKEPTKALDALLSAFPDVSYVNKDQALPDASDGTQLVGAGANETPCPVSVCEAYARTTIEGKPKTASLSESDMQTFAKTPLYKTTYAPIGAVLLAVVAGDKTKLADLADLWLGILDGAETIENPIVPNEPPKEGEYVIDFIPADADTPEGEDTEGE